MTSSSLKGAMAKKKKPPRIEGPPEPQDISGQGQCESQLPDSQVVTMGLLWFDIRFTMVLYMKTIGEWWFNGGLMGFNGFTMV